MSDDKLIECQGRAYLGGLSTSAIVFASLYFVQSFATRKWRNISQLHILGTSVAFAGTCSYLVVKEKLIECERSCNISRTDGLAKFKNQSIK